MGSPSGSPMTSETPHCRKATINSLSSVAMFSCSSCSTAASRMIGFPGPVDSQQVVAHLHVRSHVNGLVKNCENMFTGNP